MMRAATVLFLACVTAGRSEACPDEVVTEVSTSDGPATQSPCLRKIDFALVGRTLEVRYAAGASGYTQSALGSLASGFVALDLGYGIELGGDPAQPSYELEVTAGASVHRSEGTVTATGVSTRGGLRLGPARLHPAVVDDGRSNFATFPLTLELAHAGELAARPRLSARPEVARALYSRERVELTTRIFRVEAAGEKPSTAAPGATEPRKPTSWALDFFPLRTGLDLALQDGTRMETKIGGAMLGVTEHTTGASLEFFGVEHRRYDLSMGDATNLDTLWMLRVDGVDPNTGTQYFMGWGEVIDMPDRDELGRRLDPEHGNVSIGGLGWFSPQSWGGYGAQYKREPFVTMSGAVGLEDRVSAEWYLKQRIGVVLRLFGARTTRLLTDELRHDSTAGIELDATYSHGGWTTKLDLELGRTFYAALDDALPLGTGFAAGMGLTIQRAGGRMWAR